MSLDGATAEAGQPEDTKRGATQETDAGREAKGTARLTTDASLAARVLPSEPADTLIDQDDSDGTAGIGASTRLHHRLLFVLVTLCGALLLAAGAVTHFAVRTGNLPVTDRPLMRMDRMGPPPYLQNSYEDLNDDTAAVRDPFTGHVIATGVFAGAVVHPAAEPSITTLFPGSVQHFLREVSIPTYSAIFVAPSAEIKSQRVTVDLASLRLPGVVVDSDHALGLAAIVVPMSQDQASHLVGPLKFIAPPPPGTIRLPQLILRLNPASHQRSSGFILTSGGIRAPGEPWCDTSVSGSDAGSPLAEILPSGFLVLAGLAVPSPTHGQCSMIGSWAIGQILALITTRPPPDGSGAYLGVVIENTTVAHQFADYHGHWQGAYVTAVQPGSPAARAGILPGDVITWIDSRRVTSTDALVSDTRTLTPGTPHTITLVRLGHILVIRVVLGRPPAEGGQR
ncbi:MAG: PDZ domain-containing protein [Streptosporangiaceae bacterium]